jgi:hypothetical protein
MRNTFAILFLSVFLTSTFAQKQPKTVTDFYMALPTSFNIVKNLDESPFRDGFFFGEFYENGRNTSQAAITKHRKSLIEIEDIKNGYLRLKPKESEGWEEIALFKKADGEYLVAISQVECGPGCSGDLMFLAYNKGIWTNVTKQIFPSNSSSDQGYFKLPRVGTTIALIDGEDVGSAKTEDEMKKAEFKWNKVKFVGNGQ